MKTSEFITAFIASRIVETTIISTHLGDATQTATAALGDILAEFSRDCPRTKIHAFTSGTTALDLPDWYEESSLLSVEGPTGEHPRVYIPKAQIDIDRLTGKLRLVGVETGIACEARYTVMHTAELKGDVSIPVTRRTAAFYLMAATLCERIAVKHAETHRANTVDAVDYTSKSREFSALAKNFRAQYRQLVGASETTSAPAAEVVMQYSAPIWRIFP